MKKIINRFYWSGFFLIFVFRFIVYLSAIDEESFYREFFWDEVVQATPEKQPRLALVLSGGGARGLAHIGVLKVLKEERVPVQIVTGTSIGAIIGALYSNGVSPDKMEALAEEIGPTDVVDITLPNILKLFLTDRLLPTTRMEKYLRKYLDQKYFHELPVKFACVATDLVTGEKIIFREGEVVPAVRASATIPGVFEPVEYRQRLLVDGGLVSNIPSFEARLLGAEMIVAVVTASDFSRRDVNNVFQVLSQAIYIQGKVIEPQALALCDIVIYPEVGDVGIADFSRRNDCIDAGIRATRREITRIKEKIIELYLAHKS